jgi:hypothetical protein
MAETVRYPNQPSESIDFEMETKSTEMGIEGPTPIPLRSAHYPALGGKLVLRFIVLSCLDILGLFKDLVTTLLNTQIRPFFPMDRRCDWCT